MGLKQKESKRLRLTLHIDILQLQSENSSLRILGAHTIHRNMVTGASTADLAIILVDASKGLLTQSRRHAFISSLLRIPHLVVAVNKMDLVDYDEKVFDEIVADFRNFAKKLNVTDISYIPISALKGDNVVEKVREQIGIKVLLYSIIWKR